jgi:hypothetical protein
MSGGATLGDERGSLDLADLRRLVLAATRSGGITIVPEGSEVEPWTIAAVPLGPFPARLRIDAEAGVLWHDVVAAEVVPPVAVEPAIAAVPLPRPEVRLMLASTSWMVALSYPLPLARVTPSEVLGLLSAGALYATALTAELSGHHGKRWRAALAEHGVSVGVGSGHDPRDLLRGRHVAPWPQGDGTDGVAAHR